MGATLGKLESALQQSGMPPPKGRRKVVPFEKGWSQMDWVRLTQSGADLAGLGGGRPRRDITMEEVARHNTREDCWTVLRGKVGAAVQYRGWAARQTAWLSREPCRCGVWARRLSSAASTSALSQPAISHPACSVGPHTDFRMSNEPAVAAFCGPPLQVYNITPYLRFHPGGVPMLLKVAGRDGTALFNKYHAWVNYEFLLAKCLVGLLAPHSAASVPANAAGAAGGAAAAAQGQDGAAGSANGSSEQQAQPGSGSGSASGQEQQLEAAGGAEPEGDGEQQLATKL